MSNPDNGELIDATEHLFINPGKPSHCLWPTSKDAQDPHHHQQLKTVKPKVYPNILHAIGDTPLVKLNNIPQKYGVKCEVLVKCEYFNAGGSIKDRIALRMLEDAERSGKIKPGYTLIEPTSGKLDQFFPRSSPIFNG